MLADTTTDFAVVAYREDGLWQVAPMPLSLLDDLETFIVTLRRQLCEGEAIGLACLDDDFFLAVRLHGTDVRMLLSDMTAAADVPVAWQLVDKLGLPIPPEDDPGGIQPVGDLSLFSDLGLNAMELGALCDDLELYPDEMLSSIASRLGFGEPFRRAVDAALS